MYLTKQTIRNYVFYVGCMLFFIPGCQSCKNKRQWVTLTIDGEKKDFCLKPSYTLNELTDNDQYLIAVLKDLEKGKKIDINQPGPPSSYVQHTPLDLALYYNTVHGKYADIVRYLLLKGSDPNYRKSDHRDNSLHLRLFCGDWYASELVGELVCLLLAYGAKVGQLNSKLDITPPLKQLEALRPWADYSVYTTQYIHENETSLKKAYLTKIVNKLLQEKQHKPLDPDFVDYIEKSGIAPDLVVNLKDRL